MREVPAAPTLQRFSPLLRLPDITEDIRLCNAGLCGGIGVMRIGTACDGTRLWEDRWA